MLILFASRRSSPTDFRRIHDDRTPHVDPAAGAVVPYMLGADGLAYMLGTPITVLASFGINDATRTISYTVRAAWVLTAGTDSGAIAYTGDLCS